MRKLGRVLILWLAMLLALVPLAQPLRADLRTAPSWYDQNTVTTAPDWHYRVAINVPSAPVNSTVKLDVDFATLLATMGVSGTFDVNSPRVVRSTGALSTNQEYTDTVYAGATDAIGNARGEIRFILQDAGAVTYYLYFDVTQNGAKPANPQTVINGNFEFGAVGAATPPGWTTSSKVNAAYDTQIRGSESPSITTDGATLNNPFTTDGTPRTGTQSYLIGSRTNNEPGTNKNATLLDRNITVPSGTPGNLTVRWRPEGWDSDTNGGTNGFDHFKVSIITAGGVVTQIIGPAAGNYATNPFAPSFGTTAITAVAPGYGAYNSFDMGTNAVHTQGMTVAYNASPWWTINYALTAFAGQTVTIRIETGHVTQFRTWASVDDIEWSVVTATLGSPQGFGINIVAPAASGNYVPGQAIPVTVQVDANPTAATDPMTVQLFDPTGTLAAGGPYILYNDGTHGDVTAGDSIWSNDNSVPAQPAPTVPLSATNSVGWTLRAYGKDATTSTIAAQNGLIRGPGTGAATETQANFWNIDEILFNVQTAAISFVKTNSIISDPINLATKPKFIPGATVRYCLLVTNAGPAAANAIIVSDTVPANVTFTPGSMKSGTTCAGAATVEDDNNTGADESDPYGASFATGSLIAITASLANGASMALTFDAVVN